MHDLQRDFSAAASSRLMVLTMVLASLYLIDILLIYRFLDHLLSPPGELNMNILIR